VIEDANFSLDLGQCWQRIDPAGAERYGFRSDGRDIQIVVSSVTHAAGMPDDLEDFAALLAELKQRAEIDTARILGHPTTVYEPIIAAQPWGRAVVYYGHDAAGRQFGYSGAITRRCTINLYMLSEGLSERELFEAMDDVFSRIRFDRTPLPGPAHA
jgi:hypothetical protein